MAVVGYSGRLWRWLDMAVVGYCTVVGYNSRRLVGYNRRSPWAWQGRGTPFFFHVCSPLGRVTFYLDEKHI